MLALKMLIYASVNSAFSGFASLEIPLVIHVLKEKRLFNFLVGQPLSVATLRGCRVQCLQIWTRGSLIFYIYFKCNKCYRCYISVKKCNFVLLELLKL